MDETCLILLQSLYEIVCDSDEADIVRKALSALTSTSAGRQYLEMNPITV